MSVEFGLDQDFGHGELFRPGDGSAGLYADNVSEPETVGLVVCHVVLVSLYSLFHKRVSKDHHHMHHSRFVIERQSIARTLSTFGCLTCIVVLTLTVFGFSALTMTPLKFCLIPFDGVYETCRPFRTVVSIAFDSSPLKTNRQITRSRIVREQGTLIPVRSYTVD